jgi:hypothetical protein
VGEEIEQDKSETISDRLYKIF